MYLILKHAHMTVVLISILGFVARFIWCALKSKEALPKWAKIVPHINDTLLLGLGISLAWLLALNPLAHTWLLFKLLLLIAYIGLGAVALNKAQTLLGKASFVAALICFAAMAHLAVHKALPF